MNLIKTGAALTAGDMAKALNRSQLYIRGLQSRFGLPVIAGRGYSPAYLSFLQTVTYLRTLDISEESIRELWVLEKKLLQLLNVDSTGSKTWFLDACGQHTRPDRRLLLSNHDIGVEVPAAGLQIGLDFAERPRELFSGEEMGENALRTFKDYLDAFGRIREHVAAERDRVGDVERWAKRRF